MLASKEHLDHLRNLDGDRELAFENLLAGVQDDDAIGDVLDEAHQMLDHDDRHPAPRQRLDAFGNPVQFGRIEPGGEFVEQQQPRTRRERTYQVQHLLLRVVEIGRRPVGDLRQAVFVEQTGERRRRHRGINRTFQVPKPFLSLTVRQNIEVALAYGRAEVAPPTMEALLDEYRLTEVAERPAADLNNAQQKMLDLVRALATRPRLLLLDELAAGLNPAELDWIAERIKALAQSGIAIIVVEHLMGFIEHITDRVIVLNAGKEIFEGKLAVAVQVPQVIEVFLGGEHAA